jgi:hypothetical protein
MNIRNKERVFDLHSLGAGIVPLVENRTDLGVRGFPASLRKRYRPSQPQI